MTTTPRTTFTEAELDYLRGQRLGRLATVGPDGAPQAKPVGFGYNPELGTIDIGGWNMARSRKFRNVEADPRVSVVVDDIASITPWRVRGIEIRSRAETIREEIDLPQGMRSAAIRIHPDRIIAWRLAEG
jgi:pyridoxamine 5'-phosphate oxidase family protein